MLVCGFGLESRNGSMQSNTSAFLPTVSFYHGRGDRIMLIFIFAFRDVHSQLEFGSSTVL